MTQSPEFPDLPWVPPRWFATGRPEGPPRFVTIHYTAGHEGWTDAENGAQYDTWRDDKTSSHFYVDADSVVQCVRTTDQSYTAMYHGNLWGIHFELCGTAQTRDQWLDDVSRRTIANTAATAARCMTKWRIPLVRIVGTGVRSLTARGVCGHYDWTIGWPEDNGDHTDPGPQFPWDVLFADIQRSLSGGDDDMQQTEALAYPGNVKGRTVGQALVDVQNLRDWLIGVGAVFPQEPDSYPRPDSPLAVLVEAARRGPVQSAPVDVAALAAELAPHLTAAAEAAVRKVLGSLDGQ